MNEFLLALSNLNQNRKSQHKSSGQFVLGEDFILNTRGKLKRCILCSRLTRKIVTSAVSDEVKLIITIYPPNFSSFNCMVYFCFIKYNIKWLRCNIINSRNIPANQGF